MQFCIPERGGVLERFRKEKNFGSKTCSCIWIEMREGEYMLIKNNIPRNIDTAFRGI
jgi:hypothetical protein